MVVVNWLPITDARNRSRAASRKRNGRFRAARADALVRQSKQKVDVQSQSMFSLAR
jgi:hypothetical protein